jgi:hypothetical protein
MKLSDQLKIIMILWIPGNIIWTGFLIFIMNHDWQNAILWFPITVITGLLFVGGIRWLIKKYNPSLDNCDTYTSKGKKAW